MRIVSFEVDGEAHLGVRSDGKILDLSRIRPDLPRDLGDILRQGLLEEVASAARIASPSATISAADVVFLPVMMKPGKVMCLGVNYVDHASESGFKRPEYPVVFMRAASSFVGHGAPIIRPSCSDQLDYEGELVCFIGKSGRHIALADSLSHVAGYSIFNDASVRDYQMRTQQWTIGKNFDGTGGIGPDFVTADELPLGASGLKIATRLNGDVVQSASTREMIFDVANTIHILSEVMTLEAGDMLIMGTPSGVGLARTPQLWMKPGYVCEVEIEGIGTLRNPIVAEAHSGRRIGLRPLMGNSAA